MDVSVWARAWDDLEAQNSPPERLRHMRYMTWAELKEIVARSHPFHVEKLVGSLCSGDAWIVRAVFPQDFMRDLKIKTVLWTRKNPESFHKMLEGSPDFHRRIDIESGKKYSIWGCKHSAYFYRWNSDPLGIWPAITERWRIAKVVMGLKPDEYERNTPKDGVVDRIQVVRYPPAIGYLEPHADPWRHQRCFFSVYMSKRGEDYSGGGFYFVRHGKALEVEDEINVGDICLGHANLLHGVAPCDRDKSPDWNATDGRWFLSLYSNAADTVANRHTARPIKVEVPGVLPWS